MNYCYRYTKEDGKPLSHCPECRGSLTEDNAIDLCLSSGGHVFNVLTCLDEEGYLVDVEGAVARGDHSGTYCNHCGELLIDLQGVVEDDGYDEGNRSTSSTVPHIWETTCEGNTVRHLAMSQDGAEQAHMLHHGMMGTNEPIICKDLGRISNTTERALICFDPGCVLHGLSFSRVR